MSDRRDELGLDALLAAERAADDGPDPAVSERLYARVLATAALPTPPPGLEAAAEATTAATSGSAAAGAATAGAGVAAVGAGKLWLVISLLVAGGGVATWQATRPTPAAAVAAADPAPAPQTVPAPTVPAVDPLVAPEPPAPPIQPEPPRAEPPVRPARRPPPRRVAPPVPRTPRTDPDLAAERALLAQVAVALGAGDSAVALTGLRDHARRFPKGRLTEERAVFQVRALQLAGRTAEARAAAERFLRRYPKSMHRPTVQAALTEKSAP
ncbi:MAG: hypothetical protein H6702_15060 [Myxococcales bacterium]|nr:hypothetical protein [Myxococcales bacterium]